MKILIINIDSLDGYEAKNTNDKNGNPAGGTVKGAGLQIKWQGGPLGRDKDRKEPNGVFVETVISAVIQRIEFYQDSPRLALIRAVKGIVNDKQK